MPTTGLPLTSDGLGTRDTGDGCRWLYIGPITYTSETTAKMLHEKWWRDSFQGYITSMTYTATASIAMVNVPQFPAGQQHSVMFVTAVTSGTITIGADVNGSGVPAGVQVYSQLTGTGGATCPDVTCNGGIGTYEVTPDFLNVSSTAMNGGVGILTVTTPPATHKIDVTTKARISHPSMTDPGRSDGGSGLYGTYVVSGTSPGGPFNLSNPQAIHGPGGPTDPTTLYYTRFGQVDIQSGDIHHAQLWNDREYVPGSNGEMGPFIWENLHEISPNDTSIDEAGEYGPSGYHAPAYAASVAGMFGFMPHWEAAPGESFADTLAANPGVPLSGYNINNGVGIHGSGGNPAITVSMNELRLKRLQIKGDSRQVFFYNTTDRNGSGITFERNIIESGNAGRWPDTIDATIVCLAQCNYYNNLIISSAQEAVRGVYGAYLTNNTIVCPSGTCYAAHENTWNWVVSSGVMMYGNAVFGFQTVFADDWYGDGLTPPRLRGEFATFQGTNNVTDTPSTDGADFPNQYLVDPFYGYKLYAMPTYTGAQYPWSVFTQEVDGSPRTSNPVLCGWSQGPTPISKGIQEQGVCSVTHGVSPTAAFVSWPGNYRINPTGPLVGAGADYGYMYFNNGQVNVNGHIALLCGYTASNWAMTATPWSGCFPPYNTDIFGTARPQASGYDVGAMQTNNGYGPPAAYGGRLLFR
jgi:hypothetical protein